MFLLRIVGLLTGIVIGTCLLSYLFTSEKRYLHLAGRIARYALLFALVVLALLTAERLLVI